MRKLYMPLSLPLFEPMCIAIKNVAKYFHMAIISGRSRDKVYKFVGLTELHYAGSHGMDIMGPVRESESIGDHPNCIRSTDKQDIDTKGQTDIKSRPSLDNEV